MRKVVEKISPAAIVVSVCFFVAVASVALYGCAKPRRQTAESASQLPPTQPAAATTSVSNPEKAINESTPHPVAIQAAITRVFEGTVTLDQNRFLVGDFDNDGSQDLFAVVRPVKEKLSLINDELARWKLEDPRKIMFVKSIKDLRQNLQSPHDPVLATSNDLLLAIVHGHGPYGWRNPEATNAFLLKNAAGSNMTLQPLKRALVDIRGQGDLFSLKGDIVKQTLGGEAGFLFWTGADYAWHSFKGKKAVDRQSVAQLNPAR